MLRNCKTAGAAEMSGELCRSGIDRLRRKDRRQRVRGLGPGKSPRVVRGLFGSLCKSGLCPYGILLPYLDDDLAFCAPCFYIGQSLAGCVEWKDSIDNRPDHAGFYERRDLA